MACKKNLLKVDYHYDDESGMYSIGEIDFGVSGLLKEYIEKYGYEGVKEILSTLGHLSYEVKNIFYQIENNKPNTANDCCKG